MSAAAAAINGATIHQPIDGFGFSEAFGRGAIMTAQSPIRVNGGTFTATVPARSMVTYRIQA